jgi:hypothetical protein
MYACLAGNNSGCKMHFTARKNISNFKNTMVYFLAMTVSKVVFVTFFCLISSRRVPSTFLELLMPVEYFSELGGLYTAYMFVISKLNKTTEQYKSAAFFYKHL